MINLKRSNYKFLKLLKIVLYTLYFSSYLSVFIVGDIYPVS